MATPTDLVELDHKLATGDQEEKIPAAVGPLGDIRNPLGSLTLDLAAVNAKYNVAVIGGNKPGGNPLDLHDIDPDAVTFVWADQVSLDGLIVVANSKRNNEDDDDEDT